MNIVGANNSRGGHYPSQSVVYEDKLKASTLVTTIDPPQRYKKGLGEDHPRDLKNLRRANSYFEVLGRKPHAKN